MGFRESLGEFEQLALLAIWRLGQDAYGTTVREEIEQATGRTVAIGSLYTTLERLREKGYVDSLWGDATPERGGRSKRFFTLTAAGGIALTRSMEGIRKLSSGFLPAEAR